jgi:hypothetical protein
MFHKMSRNCIVITNMAVELGITSLLSLRCYLLGLNYATSRKVVGSDPNEVTDILDLPKPSSCKMVIAWTQTNRKQYQEYYKGRLKRGQPMKLTISLPSVSQLSRQCGIFGRKDLQGLLRGQLYFIYFLLRYVLRVRKGVSSIIESSRFKPKESSVTNAVLLRV